MRAGVRADPGEGLHDVLHAASDLLLAGLAHHIPQRLDLERADVGMLGSRLDPLLARRAGLVALRAALDLVGQLCVAAAAVADLVLRLLIRLERLLALDVDLATDAAGDTFVLGFDVDLEVLVGGRVGDFGPSSLTAG